MKTIRLGSKGKDVKVLQTLLHLIVDGKFGPLTEEIVKEFQTENNIIPTGIVDQETWKALGLDGGNIDFMNKRKIKEIIIHSTNTKEDENKTVSDIKKKHLKPLSKWGRGLSDIGYHFVIYLDGSIHKGRQIEKIGSHCPNHNMYSIGIAYVGGLDEEGYPKDTRTLEQKVSLIQLIMKLKQKYPKAEIYGHNEFEDVDCPCFNVKEEYSNLCDE